MTTQPAVKSGTNWFALFWLVFLLQPALALLGTRLPTLAQLQYSALLLVFVVVYVWVFYAKSVARPGTVPWRNLAGIALSFGLFSGFLPVVGGNALTFLVFAGAFGGFQGSRLVTAGTLGGVLVVLLALHAGGRIEPEATLFPALLATAAGVGNTYFHRWAIASERLAEAQREIARVAQIAERERIARDLHDLLGHSLSVIVLKSELASRLADADPARAAAEIRDVERISREALAEVRSAVRGYRATGLKSELATASLALEAAGVRLEHLLAPVELPPAHEASLSFALREAVTNVVRHSGATVCRVTLEAVGESVRLEVSDDGRGGGTDGSGLSGMRERAEDLGGTLECHRADGARLVLTLPLGRAARPAALARPAGGRA